MNNNSIINIINDMPLRVNSKSEYYNQDGYKVPRVTEILSKMIHSDSLMYWANSLGFKGLGYRETLRKAADVGTAAHAAIEQYLNQKIPTNDNIPFLGFLSWFKQLVEATNSVAIMEVEYKMACKWFGGTLDALMMINDKLYIIDFKTSNHVTYKYFLQLAAYRYMLRELGKEVDGGVIVLQMCKEYPAFNEYYLGFDIPEHLNFINQCEEAFLALVYAFYNVDVVEKGYTNLFGKD